MTHGSKITAISYYTPEKVLTNEELAQMFPEISAEEIFKRTGIKKRHVRGEGQIGSDLAFESSRLLFEEYNIDKSSIDFLLFCTEGPDYSCPATACIMQDRLGLNTSIGAMDVPMGCAGFTNGLAMAKALVESGMASKILLQTADIPTSVAHQEDLGLRMLFGDGGASVIIERKNEPSSIGEFVFGTDGSGAENLMVKNGGIRNPIDQEWINKYKDVGGMPFGRMEMDGLEIFSFSMREVPPMVHKILELNNMQMDEVDLFVFHQANAFILKMLGRKMKIPEEKVFNCIAEFGNTVSASVPIALKEAEKQGRIKPGNNVLIAAFGIGYSWSGTILKF